MGYSLAGGLGRRGNVLQLLLQQRRLRRSQRGRLTADYSLGRQPEFLR